MIIKVVSKSSIKIVKTGTVGPPGQTGPIGPEGPDRSLELLTNHFQWFNPWNPYHVGESAPKILQFMALILNGNYDCNNAWFNIDAGKLAIDINL